VGAIRFSQTSVHGALEVLFDQLAEITQKLDTIMSREQDLLEIQGRQGAMIDRLADEIGQLKTSGTAALAAKQAEVDALKSANDALVAENTALRDDAVSDAVASQLKDASDAAVAKADGAAADADATEAAWDAVVNPPAPPAESPAEPPAA
jgi:hypothetical protein